MTVVGETAKGIDMTIAEVLTIIVKAMTNRERWLNVGGRAGGHEDTCDIKNDCPA
jgi:hypothetical protein